MLMACCRGMPVPHLAIPMPHAINSGMPMS
jgi:hypothetical protein